jgi:hypothetical protein
MICIGKAAPPINGKLRNIVTQQPDMALTLYFKNKNKTGQLMIFDYSSCLDAPNSLAIDGSTRIDWNIVETDLHHSTGNKTVLAY